MHTHPSTLTGRIIHSHRRRRRTLTSNSLHGLLLGAGDGLLPPGGRPTRVLVFLQEVEDVDLGRTKEGGKREGRFRCKHEVSSIEIYIVVTYEGTFIFNVHADGG